jgi:hypothetical protein
LEVDGITRSNGSSDVITYKIRRSVLLPGGYSGNLAAIQIGAFCVLGSSADFRRHGASSEQSPDLVAQVDHLLAWNGLDAVQPTSFGTVWSPTLPASPGGQRLPGDADLASQFHVLAVRDRAGVLYGGLDAAGDELVLNQRAAAGWRQRRRAIEFGLPDCGNNNVSGMPLCARKI